MARRKKNDISIKSRIADGCKIHISSYSNGSKSMSLQQEDGQILVEISVPTRFIINDNYIAIREAYVKDILELSITSGEPILIKNENINSPGYYVYKLNKSAIKNSDFIK